MPDTPSITINKVMTYRGQPEVWSNTYHFSGTTPTSDTDWAALATFISTNELAFMRSDVKYAGYLGYAAGNNHAVSMLDKIATGGAGPAGQGETDADIAPGDSAIWVRWRTANRTSRGKTIYLRKYFHGVPNTGETISSATRAAMVSYATQMTNGSGPGGFKVCGPQGAVAGIATVAPYFTTRTLKRRGKRPSS